MQQQDDENFEDDEDSEYVDEHYHVSDLIINTFPPAAYVYVKQSTAADFSLFCATGKIASAEMLAYLLQEKGELEAYVVNMAMQN